MDPKVFAMSRNLMVKAVDLYYTQNCSQQTIAKELGVSVSTVSRLLDKAREAGMVKIVVDPAVYNTMRLERELNSLLSIKEVIVAPSESTSPVESRLAVALEGARYLQNTINDDSVLGIGFGSTIQNLIQYLNPCKKTHAQFVMLHGYYETLQYHEEMDAAIARISSTFSAQGILLESDVFIDNEGAYEYAMRRMNTRQVMEAYRNLNISVSSIGALYPQSDSKLTNAAVTNCPRIQEFVESVRPCGDICQRFYDENGQEIQLPADIHAMSISLEQYRKIPTKIVVTAGVRKTDALLAALRGGLVDVLVIDRPLARELMDRIIENNGL